MKRIICLALVLVLLFQVFAMPASAATLGTGLLIGVAATSVVASALIGLGVLPGSDGSVFDGLVNDAVAHLQSLGFGDGTTIPVLKYLGTAGNVMYALQTAALTALRSWLFAEEVVSVSSPFLVSGQNITVSSYNYTANGNECVVFEYQNASRFVTLYLLPSGSSSFLSYQGTTNSIGSPSLSLTLPEPVLGSTTWFYKNLYSSSSSSYSLSYFWSSGTFSEFVYSVLSSGSSFSSSYDVSLGDVAPEDEEISVAYPSWGYGSVEIPASGDDEDPDPFIPVTLLPTYDETKGLTQDQAQSGESSLETDNNGTSVDVSGDVGGSITPDGGGGDLPEGESYPTVSDLTTMFAWLASSIDRSVELLFPDLQVIKTYLKALAQWEENKDVQLTSILSYLSGFDTDIDTMLTNLSSIDVNLTSMLSHAENSVSILTGIASDVKDIRDVIADPLDADINESQQDNKSAFLDNFASKSQSENIGDLAGLSGGMTDWFKLDGVDITSMFDQVESGYGQWFTSETAQAICVGGGSASVAAAAGVELMEDAEYVEPETPYLDAWDQEVQDILAGGDGEW